MLPSGERVSLDGFVDKEMYASCEVRGAVCNPLEPFSAGRSQMIPGGSRPASLADTNLPRPGDTGLPKDWRGIVRGWRAVLDAPPAVLASGALACWLARTTADFRYNGKSCMSAPLVDLVDPSRRLPMEPESGDPPDTLPQRLWDTPVAMVEMLGFGVRIDPQDTLAITALALALKHAGAPLRIRVCLRGLWRGGLW